MTSSPVTLITGGSVGIGAAVATRLLCEGHRVSVTGRNRDRLSRLASELGNPADLLAFTGDAADYATVRSAVESTVRRRGTWRS